VGQTIGIQVANGYIARIIKPYGVMNIVISCNTSTPDLTYIDFVARGILAQYMGWHDRRETYHCCRAQGRFTDKLSSLHIVWIRIFRFLDLKILTFMFICKGLPIVFGLL